MRKVNFKGLFVSALILSASCFMSQDAFSQSTTTERTKQPASSIQKTDDSKATKSNPNDRTLSTTPALTDREREKMSNANKYGAEKGAVEKRDITIIDLPGYPKYEMTGDAKADELRYQEAKAKWIRENPEAYQKLLNKNPKVKEEEVRKYRKTPQSK